MIIVFARYIVTDDEGLLHTTTSDFPVGFLGQVSNLDLIYRRGPERSTTASPESSVCEGGVGAEALSSNQ